MRSSRLVGWLVAVAALAPTWSCVAQEPAEDVKAAGSEAATAKGLSEDQRRLNLESFDEIWATIKAKHFDPDLNGADWEGARAELRPKVEAATTMEEAREPMTALIDRLGQSHFGLLPRAVYDTMEDVEGGRRPGEGVVGLDARVVEGQALVVEVEPDQPAARAGVKAGWVLAKVDGKELAPVLEKVRGAYRESTQLDLRLTATVEARLSGAVGEEVELEFLDGDGRCRPLKLELAKPLGTPTRFGNLPTFYVHIDERKVDQDIPYIAFNAFFDPSRVVPTVGEFVKSNLEAPGVILDLRGNPGGIGAMAMGIGGWFFDESGHKLGTMVTRDAELKFTILPRRETYGGPLALLVDGCSASTTEILVGGLQDLGRGRVFGTRTAGAALPSMIVRLPNGDGFQYVFANYLSEDGKSLEGQGVTPDEEVSPSREALLGGHDPVLDAAVAWIRSRASAKVAGVAGATSEATPR